MVLAVQFWMGVPGALIYGMMSDRFSLTKLFVGMLVVCAGILGLFATSPGTWVVAALCVVFGFASSGMIPLYMVLLGQRLGADAIGRSVGLESADASGHGRLGALRGLGLRVERELRGGARRLRRGGTRFDRLPARVDRGKRRAAKQLGTEVVSA